MRSECFALLISVGALLAQKDADTDDPLNRGRQAFEEFKPADDSAGNIALGQKARTAFEEVLARDPNNKAALEYLAELTFRQSIGIFDPARKLAKLDEARSWFLKLAAVDPREKEAWYSLGVIDWYHWHPKWVEALQCAGMQPDEQRPIPDPQIRHDLRESAHFVDDGLANLQKALEIDPRYPDALDFMSTLLCERASIAETIEQFHADRAAAKEWADQEALVKKAEGTPAASRPPRTPGRIRVGGNVQMCNLIAKVEPVYPELARQARIQGTVRFLVIIAADGRLRSTQLVSGHPLLVQAALDAIQQWVWRPTLLNGKPVEVVTTVDLNFSLEKSILSDSPCSL